MKWASNTELRIDPINTNAVDQTGIYLLIQAYDVQTKKSIDQVRKESVNSSRGVTLVS